MSIQMTTLPNGLRIVTDYVPSVDSVAVGVWVGVGARHETLVHNGVSHMVEHMMFKGTPSRSAAQIAEEIENVGGQMNAFTSREITAYYIHLLKQDLPLAVNILADIVQRPTMPDEEVERERHVILQEIGMTADTPDDIIFDDHLETAYPKQALGAPILGTSTIISSMKRDVLYRYVKDNYVPEQLVVSAAGNVDHDAFVVMVEDAFADMEQSQVTPITDAQYQGGVHLTEKDLEQSHVILGFRGVSRHDDSHPSVSLLSTILGDGMSSRLFQEIREKRGLVYTIFSNHQTFQDDGQFMIYAGTGPNDLPELMPVLCGEIEKSFAPVTAGELSRAKAQLRAQMLMGRESMLTRANQQAKYLIHFDKVLNVQERLDRIEAVTIENVQAAAKRVFSTKPTLTARGPLSQLESYDCISKRLGQAA